MTDEAMSPLRRRMIEDMTIRKLAPKTQQGCIRTIKDSLCSTASFEGVRPLSCIWRRTVLVLALPRIRDIGGEFTKLFLGFGVGHVRGAACICRPDPANRSSVRTWDSVAHRSKR